MDLIPTSDFVLQSAEIQYFPDHHCPKCGAEGTTNQKGVWYVGYQDLFGSALRVWEGQFGYVWFACLCTHNPGPGLRVARLGDALIPLPFTKVCNSPGKDRDAANAVRIMKAISFLAAEADPKRTCTSSPVLKVLLELTSGIINFQQAETRITRVIQTFPYPTEADQG